MKYIVSIIFILVIISISSITRAQIPVPIPNEASGSGCNTDPTQCWGYKLRQDINNRFNGTVATTPQFLSVPFANLPAPSLFIAKPLWCQDCQQTPTCSGGGSGALAIPVGSTWQCTSPIVPSEVSGDCVFTSPNTFTCGKTNGVPFGPFATGTNASNLSGTLNSSNGGTGTNIVPTAGQVPIGNSSGTNYMPTSLSGDISLNSAGQTSVTGLHFGSTDIQTTNIAPISGQCLEYNGTGWTGISCSSDGSINVQTYGGNIQSALNAVPSTGGVVYVPPGTYNLTSALNIPTSNTYLHCAGNDTTIIQGAVNQSDAALLRIGNGQATNLSNIVISDCWFKGQWSTGSPALVAHPANGGAFTVDHVWLQRNRFTNSSMGVALGTVFLQPGDNFLWILDNNFENTDIQCSGCADTIVQSNQIINPFDVAISLGGNASTVATRVLINNNNIRRTVQTNPQGGTINVNSCTHCRISNNTVIGAYGAGIIAGDAGTGVYDSFLDIIGNITNQNSNNACTQCGGIYVDSPTVANITGNLAYNNNGTGITLTGATTHPCKDVTVSGNTSVDNGLTGGPVANGIEVSTCTGAAVTGNLIYDDRGTPLQGQGLKIDAPGADTVTKNYTVSGNSSFGNALNDVLVTANPIGPIYVNDTTGKVTLNSKNQRWGTVTISGTATTTTVTLPSTEPDTAYTVNLTISSVTGTPVAVGNIWASAIGTTSFVANVGTAPGVGNSVVLKWRIGRDY